MRTGFKKYGYTDDEHIAMNIKDKGIVIFAELLMDCLTEAMTMERVGGMPPVELPNSN